MVELKLQQVGDALGIVLPPEIVERLRIEEGGPVFLQEDADGSYRLVTRESSFEETMAKGREIMDRYPNTLDALAR